MVKSKEEVKKYTKQLKLEIGEVKKQLKKRTYVSIAITLVLTGAAVASACGASGNFV